MLYKMIKTIVTRGTYERDDMQKKLDIFLLNNRITDAEYTELVALMDANMEV